MRATTWFVPLVSACGLALASASWAVNVSISQPDPLPGKYPKGAEVTFKCTITDGGDDDYFVVWKFWDDGPDWHYEGKNLTTVTRACQMPGAHEFWVIVFDMTRENQVAMASGCFWVLWVQLSVGSAGTEVALDNQGGVTWYQATRNPQTRALGLQTTFKGVQTGMQYSGVCTPRQWDRTVSMKRDVSGHHYGGPGGDIVRDSAVGDDTSDPIWLDEDPQSATYYWGGENKSDGVVYDVDPPGYSVKTDGVCRVRANFREWAQYDASVVSDHLDTHCASSVTWDGTSWQVVHTYDGLGDNSAGTGWVNLNWNMQ